MALRDILPELAADNGYKLSEPEARAYLINNLNAVAKDWYNTLDLSWCWREQYMEIGVADQLISFPWYVDRIAGMREPDGNFVLNTMTMKPRYQKVTWSNIIEFPRITRKLPLKRALNGYEKLYIHLKKASSQDIIFNFAGRTTYAERHTEQVVVTAGTLVKPFAALYEEINSITKMERSDVDIIISRSEDVDDESSYVGEMPNHQDECLNIIIQAGDFYTLFGQTRIIEVLYKQKFIPFFDDSDEFPCTNIYDKALQLGAHARLMGKDPTKLGVAGELLLQAQRMLVDISDKQTEDALQPMAFQPSGSQAFHETDPCFIARYPYRNGRFLQ
jgi:hypothetical protein